MHQDAELYQAAELYWVQGMTMDAVAERFGVSRSTVSRMLQGARDRGIVRISLASPGSPVDDLSRTLQSTFGVTVHVAGTARSATDSQRLESVARCAAALLGEWFGDGMTLAVAWGTTTSAVASHLQPKRTRSATVVQMNGAVNVHPAGAARSATLLAQMSTAFNAALYPFPTPAFFDDERTRELMWQESTVRRVLAVRNTADLAVFSVGAFRGPMVSQVYSGGYLDEDAFRTLTAQRVVGDVCTVFLREDGTYADIGLNRRASGPTPSELRRIPRRLCVVSGEHKIRGLVGALRAGVVTDLVVDERTAGGVVRYLSGR
ncbi:MULTISPECIES: sugar-binding transcriptional regulator [Kocuria]|jgi:deoxyribonucleoside regulator|uniref:sugar-binding transcriptional regulator n=1 Tax=Kocuria TaxID=57493 RepID=UPI002041BE63|nr:MULTISPECIES: sugar-binding domain-containing protein [Kocuria]MCM3687469.1 helix-turn-helix domain-containing protein [Kocuria rosea]HST73366.1 sugar-binding domain-containing protein [Kocuria rosea]